VITLLRERGNGPTLVLFLAGLDGNLGQWDLVTPQLEDIGANLAYGAPLLPHPAFDGSQPTVTAFAHVMAEELRREKWGDVLIVAHSAGAFAALGVARTLPEAVREVILISGGLTRVARFLDHPMRELVARPRTCLSALWLFALVATPTPPALRQAVVRSERLSRAVLGGLVSSAALESEERRRSLMGTSATPAALRGLWVNRHYWQEFRSYADDIRPKVLFLVGGADPLSGELDTQTMAAMLPKAEVRVLPGVGHAAPLEAPGAVVAAIREALKEPAPGP
jgi:pimeloyl-ACP methyl ester carboxylesterase